MTRRRGPSLRGKKSRGRDTAGLRASSRGREKKMRDKNRGIRGGEEDKSKGAEKVASGPDVEK